jgi:hypothetical protein
MIYYLQDCWFVGFHGDKKIIALLMLCFIGPGPAKATARVDR